MIAKLRDLAVIALAIAGALYLLDDAASTRRYRTSLQRAAS